MRFILFVLLLAPCLALDAWVENGGNVTFEGEIFTIHSASDTGLLFESNNSARRKVVVPYLEDVMQEGLVYTFDEVKNDLDEYLEKYNLSDIHSADSGTLSYHISIEKPMPSIKQSKSLSRTELAVKDKFNMTITISNSGNAQASVKYNEPLPAYIKKTGSLRYYIDGKEYEYNYNSNSIVWQGIVKESSSIRLEQELELAGTTSTGIISMMAGDIEFTYMEDTQHINSSAIDIKYIYPLETEYSFAADPIYADDVQDVSLTLTKLRKNIVDIAGLEITFSDGMTLEDDDVELMDIKGNTLTWHGEVDEPIVFEFKVRPLYAGESIVTTKFVAKYKGLSKEFDEDGNFITEIDEPVAGLGMETAVTSHKQLNMTFVLDNSGEFTFKDVQINVTSPLFDDYAFLYPTLEGGRKVSNGMQPKMAWYDADTNSYVNVSYSFKTEFGQKLKDRIDRAVTVKKIDFDPLMDISLVNYTWVQENGTNRLIMNLGISSNTTISSASIRVEGAGKAAFITPAITANLTNYAKELVFPMNNTPSELAARGSYVLNDETYYFSDSFSLDSPGYVAPANQAPAAKPAAPEQSGQPLDYMQKASPIKAEKVTLDARLIITAALVILSVFFVIIIAIIIPKQVKKKEIKKFHTESTERLEDVHTPQAVKFNLDKRSVDDAAPDPTTDLNLLQQYIDACRSQGTSNEKIKQQLIGKGWLEDVVEVYLK